MNELKKTKATDEYIPPKVLRLGSSATITASQVQTLSDDGITADNANPNPTDPS